ESSAEASLLSANCERAHQESRELYWCEALRQTAAPHCPDPGRSDPVPARPDDTDRKRSGYPRTQQAPESNRGHLVDLEQYYTGRLPPTAVDRRVSFQSPCSQSRNANVGFQGCV